VKRSLALFIAVATPAAADPYTPPDFLTQPPPLPQMFDASTAWRLDLADALKLALRDNLGLAIERENLRAASLGITYANGEFEPTLTSGFTYSNARQPPLTAQAEQMGMAGTIVSSDSDDFSLSLGQRLSTGMQLGVSFETLRSKSTAGTAVEPLNYLSTAVLSVKQPVLRGFSMDRVIPRIDVLHAEIANAREREQLAVKASDVIEQTEDAYWDVVQALYQYDLDVRSQQLAVEQMDLTKRQIVAGLLPVGDLTSAEATLASRELTVLRGQQTVEQAWDALRAVLNLPHDQWTRPILPTDMPGFNEQDTTAEAEMKHAIDNRPELLQARLDMADEELNVRRAENNRLPEIDVGVSGTLTGQDSTFGGTLHELGRADATIYAVTLNLIWTPLQRATRAAAEIERTRHKVVETNNALIVQTVWVAVREAVRSQAAAARQVFAAAKARELAAKNLELEQRKFVTGQSSNFLIGQHQEQLAQAQLDELQAVLTHKKQQAALLKATGQLLEERHVQLTPRQ
jgi:outer membrane protein TolC